MSEKRYFSCPVAEFDFEDSSEHYTTDECGVCCCFWDCKTGLEECLQDEDFKEHFGEMRKALKELNGKW